MKRGHVVVLLVLVITLVLIGAETPSQSDTPELNCTLSPDWETTLDTLSNKDYMVKREAIKSINATTDPCEMSAAIEPLSIILANDDRRHDIHTRQMAAKSLVRISKRLPEKESYAAINPVIDVLLNKSKADTVRASCAKSLGSVDESLSRDVLEDVAADEGNAIIIRWEACESLTSYMKIHSLPKSCGFYEAVDGNPQVLLSDALNELANEKAGLISSESLSPEARWIKIHFPFLLPTLISAMGQETSPAIPE